MEIVLDVRATRKEVAEALARYMHTYLAGGGSAALAGGRTPIAGYKIFASYTDVGWKSVNLIPTDERCYPEGHPERNDTLIRSIFASRGCSIYSLENFLEKDHPVSIELEKFIPFDLTVLGLGEDGHTASLFPGNPAIYSRERVVRIFGSPKTPSKRLSLSLNTIGSSKKIIFCVTGESKKYALKALVEHENIPASQIPAEDKVIILADYDAAGSFSH